MQAHAEHQQDDADIGYLLRQPLISDKPGGERPNQHTREQVPQQRRQFQPRRDGAKDECQAKAHRQKRDQGRFMRQ